MGEFYDVDDLLLVIWSGFLVDNKFYVVFFYGESFMVMYCIDLMEKVGLKMFKVLIWEFICIVVEVMIDKDVGVYGICLCGKVGWGENIVLFMLMFNLFGVCWFDENWKL